MDIISVLLMSAKKMLKPCRRKEANVLKKVYEEDRLLKKKMEALIHSSHHTQRNSITVNSIFLRETIWFSWLSNSDLSLNSWRKEPGFSNFLKFNISIKGTLYCSCSFDSWWICWSMWWTFFYFSLEECYVCDVHASITIKPSGSLPQK